jgi:ABC-type Fe3+-siderophore transport system permease subunit
MSKTQSSTKAISLVGMILSGIFLGFYWQRMADSGQLHFRRIAVACIISAGSYVVAFLLIESRKRAGSPSNWLLAAILGSLLSAFNIKVVKYIIQSAQDPNTSSLSGQLYEISLGFVGSAVIYLGVAIIVIGTVHFFARRLGRLFSTR